MYKAKILISTRSPISNLDGTTIRAKKMFNILNEYFYVSLITRANKHEIIDCLNKKNIFTVKPKSSKLWPLKIIPTLFTNKFDIVICENDWLGFPTYWIFSKIRKYNIIFEAHGVLSDEAKDWGYNFFMIKLFKFIEKFTLRRSDFVIALSEEIKTKYEKYNQNIKLIPVFIDDFNFEQNKTIQTKKRVGIIGPFGSKRNEYYTPDFVYENLNKFNSEIQFIIIGKCKKDYQTFRIEKIGYIHSFDEYMHRIAEMDAILVIEKRKTSGPLNKILEAMTCETPVFTTHKGTLGIEQIENGKNIIISSESELISKLNKLLFDEKMLNKLSKNAKDLIKNYYSVDKNKNKIIYSIIELSQ